MLTLQVQYVEGTDRLHLEDRIKVCSSSLFSFFVSFMISYIDLRQVFIRGATHLPALDADGGISARVVMQVLHPMSKEVSLILYRQLFARFDPPPPFSPAPFFR